MLRELVEAFVLIAFIPVSSIFFAQSGIKKGHYTYRGVFWKKKSFDAVNVCFSAIVIIQ
jgi:hypothetical protein